MFLLETFQIAYLHGLSYLGHVQFSFNINLTPKNWVDINAFSSNFMVAKAFRNGKDTKELSYYLVCVQVRGAEEHLRQRPIVWAIAGEQVVAVFRFQLDGDRNKIPVFTDVHQSHARWAEGLAARRDVHEVDAAVFVICSRVVGKVQSVLLWRQVGSVFVVS